MKPKNPKEALSERYLLAKLLMVENRRRLYTGISIALEPYRKEILSIRKKH